MKTNRFEDFLETFFDPHLWWHITKVVSPLVGLAVLGFFLTKYFGLF